MGWLIFIPKQFSITRPSYFFLLQALFKVLQEGKNDVLISGGPLGEVVYAFEQLHFHWGENDWEGSEDKINNQSYAMELHAVFYKLVYGSMAEATKYSDGLTVLAYFLEVIFACVILENWKIN